MQSGDWCIYGDFNVVVSRKERRGTSVVSSSTVRRAFLQFIEAMELVDPGLGKQFSWLGPYGQSIYEQTR